MLVNKYLVHTLLIFPRAHHPCKMQKSRLDEDTGCLGINTERDALGDRQDVRDQSIPSNILLRNILVLIHLGFG